jgi:outer membrane protein TolC
MTRFARRALGLAGAALLSACTTVGPDFKRPEVPWLDAWKGGSLESMGADRRLPRSEQLQQWWRNFDDPVLDQLVAEAQRANPNVRTAGLRIMEARAQLGIAGSTLYPRCSRSPASCSASASTGAEARTPRHWPSTRVPGQLGARLLGQVQAQHRGRGCRLPGQHCPVRRSAGLMAAQVAGFYASIRTVEARLLIARQNAALQKRSLDIAERLFKSGNDSELDVQQARAQYLGTLATIPALEAACARHRTR